MMSGYRLSLASFLSALLLALSVLLFVVPGIEQVLSTLAGSLEPKLLSYFQTVLVLAATLVVVLLLIAPSLTYARRFD